MKTHESYLKNEAAYQDSKVEKNVRTSVSKFYQDASSKLIGDYQANFIGDVKDQRILDLGCGLGTETMKALHAGAYVTAVDISPKSVELVMERAKKENIDSRLTAMVDDAHHLSLCDNSFDIVMGTGILHHLPQLSQAISEIYRVLKPGGHAVFVEPMGINFMLCAFRALTPKWRTVDEQPFQMKHLNIIREQFANTQFVFFDCATLLSKVFVAMHLQSFAQVIWKPLNMIDERLLRKERQKNINFFQKMSWRVLIRMEKCGNP